MNGVHCYVWLQVFLGGVYAGDVKGMASTAMSGCRYFSVESTQEMLNEWRPLLCLFDVKMSEGLFYLDLFLPTVMYPHEYDQGFRFHC